MNIYVAAKWEDRLRARVYMHLLEDAGHTITYDWTECTDFSPAQASRDKQGVMEADALVFIAVDNLNYKGALVEMGIAVGRGIPIYIVGKAIDECLFTVLPEIRRGLEGLL